MLPQNEQASSGVQTEFGGGGILPPTPEEHVEMWRQQSKQMKQQEFEAKAKANLQAARKRVFMEQVQQATAVNPRLSDAFHGSINIMESPTAKKRSRKGR